MNWLNIILSVVVICVSSYISITLPISESGIPFTAQSLAVFVVAAFLNRKEIIITLVLYLILGITGAPVFADGTSGFSKIIGPSGGFLYGFIFASFFISSMLSHQKSRKLTHLTLIFIAATIILFIFGLSHLAFKFGTLKALEYGFYPFWKMALIKALIATFVIYLVKRDISS